MANKDELAAKRTHLADKRTELAYERTVMAYFRTSTTIILFGIAFIGFSETRWDFVFYAGVIAIAFGVFLGIVALERAITHMREIRHIKQFFKSKVKALKVNK